MKESSGCGDQRATSMGNRAASQYSGSLLHPGLAAVRAAPDFVVAGGEDDLRRALQVDMSYVGAQRLAFNGWPHRQPGYAAVNGMEKRASLAAGPYILVEACLAEQGMIRVQSVLP